MFRAAGRPRSHAPPKLTAQLQRLLRAQLGRLRRKPTCASHNLPMAKSCSCFGRSQAARASWSRARQLQNFASASDLRDANSPALPPDPPAHAAVSDFSSIRPLTIADRSWPFQDEAAARTASLADLSSHCPNGGGPPLARSARNSRTASSDRTRKRFDSAHWTMPKFSEHTVARRGARSPRVAAGYPLRSRDRSRLRSPEAAPQ